MSVVSLSLLLVVVALLAPLPAKSQPLFDDTDGLFKNILPKPHVNITIEPIIINSDNSTTKYVDLINIGEKFGVYTSVDFGNLFQLLGTDLSRFDLDLYVRGSSVVLEPFTIQANFLHFLIPDPSLSKSAKRNDKRAPTMKKNLRDIGTLLNRISKYTQTVPPTIEIGELSINPPDLLDIPSDLLPLQNDSQSTIFGILPRISFGFDDIHFSSLGDDGGGTENFAMENFLSTRVLALGIGCGDIIDSLSFNLTAAIRVTLLNGTVHVYHSEDIPFTVINPVVVICPSENPCVRGYCDEETNECTYENLEGTPCQTTDGDGEPDLCIINSQCSSGACIEGSVKSCDDENPCTVDSCDPSTGQCIHKFIEDPLSEGFESYAEICSDGDPCTVDSCSDGWGCIHTPYECSLVGSNSMECSQSSCIPDPEDSSQPLCIDTPYRESLPCFSFDDHSIVPDSVTQCVSHIGVCNESGNCTAVMIDCDDGIFCNGRELCINGTCASEGIAPSCDDGDPCTTDVCSSSLDACIHLPYVPIDCVTGQGTGLCDLGRTECDSETGDIQCVPIYSPPTETTPSNCTHNFDSNCDSVFEADCSVVCDTDSDCDQIQDEIHSSQCIRKYCNTELRECVVEFLSEKSCDDGNPCTIGEVCNAGVCALPHGVSHVTPCTSTKPCMDSICVPLNNVFYNCEEIPKSLGASCSSGTGCTLSETCDGQGNCIGSPMFCPSVNGSPSSSSSSNNNGCIDSVCVGGTCHPSGVIVDLEELFSSGVPSNCDDYNLCTQEFCTTDGECISEPVSVPVSLNPCTMFICDPSLEENQQPHHYDPSEQQPRTPTFSEVDRINGSSCQIIPSDESCSSEGICISGECVPLTHDDHSCVLQGVNDPRLISPCGEYRYSIECVSLQCNPFTEECQVVFNNETNTACVDPRPAYQNGVCIPGTGICAGTPPDCSSLIDDDQCQTTFFDIETGACILVNTTGPCDDGNSCTYDDRCQQGTCTGTPILCEDGIFCNGVSECIDGECVVQPESIPDCTNPDPNDLCGIGFCNETSRMCEIKPPDYTGEPCGVSSFGLCRLGHYECCESTGEPECIGAVLPTSPVDLCNHDGSPNGIDENCDGLVDESCTHLCSKCSSECPEFPCLSAICKVGGVCQYFCVEGSCSLGTHPCTGEPIEGTCSQGVCQTAATIDDLSECCLPDLSPSEQQCLIVGCWWNEDTEEHECRTNGVRIDASCDDGDPCTINDVCDSSGGCRGVPMVCDDNNQCTEDRCELGVCIYEFKDDAPCETYSACEYNGRCSLATGQCEPTLFVDCDDGNPCTQDECIEINNYPVCVSSPHVQTGNSSGGCIIPCDTCADFCHPRGFCVPGTSMCHLEEKLYTPLPLSSSGRIIDPIHEQCIERQCDPLTGSFIEIPLSGIPCDDGKICTDNDQCWNGQCVGTLKSVPIESTSFDSECVVSLCLEYVSDDPQIPPGVLPGEPFYINVPGRCGHDNGGCSTSECIQGVCQVVEEMECDDGIYCNGEEFCLDGECIQGTPIVCVDMDQNPCTIPRCSELHRGCIELPIPSIGQPCGNSTVGQCTMGTIQCLSGDNITCDDDDDDIDALPSISCVGAVYPNEIEICGDGIDNNCNGVVDEGCGIPCTSFDEEIDCPEVPCNRAVCSPFGFCTYVPQDDGTGCSDGLYCTINDRCENGACVSDPYPQYDPQNPCVELTCHEDNMGNVTRSNVTRGSGVCSDDNLCTFLDTCDGVGNCVGIPITCNDFNSSTIDYCDATTGLCVFEDPPGTTDDEDGDCDQSVDCDDGNDCTLDYYDRRLRTCSHTPLGFLLVQSGRPGVQYDPLRHDPDDEILIPCNNHSNLCLEQSYCHLGVCIEGLPIYKPNPNQCIETVCEPCTGEIRNIPRVNETCVTNDRCEINTICNAQGECVGEVNHCDDSNPCTDDYCDDRTGRCLNIPGSCGSICMEKDGFICKCEHGECVCDPINCSNGIFCDGEEYWFNGTCVPGVPPDCQTADLCSQSFCSERQKKCITVPLPGIGEQCGHPTNGTCKAGRTRCNATNGEIYCHGYIGPEPRDLCDGLDRNCDGYVDTHCELWCETNQDCVQADQQQNPCLVPLCQANHTCTQIPVAPGITCEPHQKSPCVESYQCFSGLCKPSCVVECPIDDYFDEQCVEASCCESSGDCVERFLDGKDCEYGQYRIGGYCSEGLCVPNPICCDDHNECTEDIFDPDHDPVCRHVPRVGEECSTGNACVINGICSSCGECEGVSRNDLPVSEGGCMEDGPESSECSYSVCVPTKGRKSHGGGRGRKGPSKWFDERDDDDLSHTYGDNSECYKCVRKYKTNGIPCFNGDSCSLDQKCRNGLCVGTPKNCSSNCNICIEESCNSLTGQCEVRFNNDRLCPNQDKCTKNSKCENGICSGEPVECKFNPRKYPRLDAQCVEMECDPDKGCIMTYPHGDCDDGDECTTHDRCNAGVCEGVPILCDDGNPCNGVEYCRKGECRPGKPVLCDDHNLCTVDFCERETGKCVHQPLSDIGKPCGPDYAYRGECRPGRYECGRDCGLMCVGVKGPKPEKCGAFGLGDGLDQDCDGVIDNGCGINCSSDRDCDLSCIGNRGNETISESFLEFTRGKISLCAQNGTCVYIDPDCADPGSRGDPRRNDLKYWRHSHSRCVNGWWGRSERTDPVSGKDIFECQCKFGWTGKSCDECSLVPPRNSDMVYRCIRNRDRHAILERSSGSLSLEKFSREDAHHTDDDDRVMMFNQNAYELVLVDKEAIRKYERWFWGRYSSSSSTSSSSTIWGTSDNLSSSSEEEQEDGTPPCETSQDSSSHSSSWNDLPLRKGQSSSSSSSSSSDSLLFDLDDFSIIDFFSNIFGSLSSSDGDDSSSQSDETRSDHSLLSITSSSSEKTTDDEETSRLYSSLLSDDDDRDERRNHRGGKPIYIVPGTRGLSCTCEIEGEYPIFDRDPMAVCNIKEVEVVMRPHGDHDDDELSFSDFISISHSDYHTIVFMVFAGLVIILIGSLCCIGCYFCCISKYHRNRGTTGYAHPERSKKKGRKWNKAMESLNLVLG